MDQGVVDTVLRFFPESAFYTVTGMSERALVYSEEPLTHRNHRDLRGGGHGQ